MTTEHTPRLTHAQKDVVIAALAATLPGTMVRRVYREISDQIGADGLAVAHELIAAGNRTLAGPGRVCLAQAQRLAEARKRTVDGVPVNTP